MTDCPSPTRGTWRQRAVVRLIRVATAFIRRLPHPLLHRLAHAAGGALYLAQPARLELVRANLARICGYLDARGLGSASARAAAHDPQVLERLVRRAFGHYLRSYLEVLLAPDHTPENVDVRLQLDDPETLRRVLDEIHRPDSPGLLLVALHYGSIELAGIWITARTKLPMTVPIETIDDPPLQAFLTASRAATGVRLVPAERAARELVAAMSRREAVAIVADRPLDSPGRMVSLFGAPAPLPIGPALLALESDATVIVGAARRIGWERYAGRVVPLSVSREGSRRERVDAFLAAEVAVFESLIADAPEQWWTIFFPIWPDIPGPGASQASPTPQAGAAAR
jgi:lauroyl/myristoyl acyltransferase